MRLRVDPPMDYPLLFRVFGEEPEMVRKIADQVAKIVSEHPHTIDVNDDWHDRIPSYRLELDQEKARAMGISTAKLSQALQAHYTGITIGQSREDNKLIDIVLRSHQLTKTSELPDVYSTLHQ